MMSILPPLSERVALSAWRRLWLLIFLYMIRSVQNNLLQSFCTTAWLDLFYLHNYTTLAQSASCILYMYSVLHSAQTGQMYMAVGIIVSLYGVLVVATVLYHVIVPIHMVCNVQEKGGNKISRLPRSNLISNHG